MIARRFLILITLVAFAPSARAGFLARIGDVDGFGYGSAPGFRAANGGPANVGGSGVLTNGDFLPDIDRGGTVANGGLDEFDFRSAAERANTSVTVGAGVTNTAGTVGSSFTDISLSRSYDDRSAAGRILVGGNPNTGLIFGPGGAFPSPPSSVLPNQPGFAFRFDVDASAVDPSAPIFFNLVFGDYDVFPAQIQVTGANGTRFINLTQQSANADGLIQAATASLNFNDVFTVNGLGYRGSLTVDFLAPNEPYTAFDYVELSTTRLVAPTGTAPVPPGFVVAAFGAVGLFAGLRRRMTS